MATFETEMKRAYSEALAPYGFKKLKGRYPYFVRMAGEEILQVITYYKDKGLEPSQVFCMFCGIATVYRKKINLECSPRDNTLWLLPYRNIYMDSHPFCSWEDVPEYSFEYEMPEEMSLRRLENATKYGGVIKVVSPYPLPTMQEAIERSLDLTRQEIIPVFNTVTDLKSCAEYYQKYDSLCIHMDERFPFDWVLNYREQLFNLKVYDSADEFSKARSKDRKLNIQVVQHRNKNKWPSYLEIDSEETMWSEANEANQKQTALFEKLLNDPEIHTEALAELELRRQQNTETLRGYGLL